VSLECARVILAASGCCETRGLRSSRPDSTAPFLAIIRFTSTRFVSFLPVCIDTPFHALFGPAYTGVTRTRLAASHVEAGPLPDDAVACTLLPFEKFPPDPP